MTTAFRPVVLIPTFDNPMTVRAVVEEVRLHLPDVLVVDDGSGEAGRAACEAIAEAGLARVHHLPENAGKGAAVKRGFELARELGYTHALQVDADGQHELARIPAFLEAGAADPEALLLAYPEYDQSAPRGRKIARKITAFWVALEVGRGRIRDAMIGFRLYPLARALAAGARGDRMDFDVEIAVLMVRDGGPVRNLPVAVHYPAAEAGGVSHFRPLRDNLGFFWLHCRLCTRGAIAFFRRLLGFRR